MNNISMNNIGINNTLSTISENDEYVTANANDNAKQIEPLLTETEERFVMFPIHDESIWAMYKKQVVCFCRAVEVDLSKDLSSWETLSNDEQNFIKAIIAFFAASDGIVLENLATRFMSDVQLAEARAFYGFQIAMENIHSEMYSLLIETYIKDKNEKTRLFQALAHYPCIKKKADWTREWIHSKEDSFAARLVAFHGSHPLCSVCVGDCASPAAVGEHQSA